MASRLDPDLIPPAPDTCLEAALWQAQVLRVAGVDEAGRGALAGPVAAAAVILPADGGIGDQLHGVRDSKQMPAAARQAWAETIRQVALAWCVGMASNLEIDELGILPATKLAMQRAVEGLHLAPEHLLIDFLFLPEIPTPQTALIKGDSRCLSIAAASILAKTARDNRMVELDAAYPGYGFAVHKGYCTQGHLNSLERLGPAEVHRRSFRPVFQECAEPETFP